MLGLGGISDKAEDTDPRTRCVTLSNGFVRRFFDEPWGISSPFGLSMFEWIMSPETVDCEKLPDLRLFRIDFLMLPVLFSGRGGVGGEGSTVAGGCGGDVWFEEGLLGWIGYFESWSNRS